MAIRKRFRFLLNYFIGPLLFVVMAFSIYRQLQHHENLAQKWQIIKASLVGSQAWRLYAVIGLMLVNWGIEAKKWQLLLRHMKQISYAKAYKSVLSGVAFTIVTPNRMGEFIGRVFYVEDGQRIRAATLTIVGSISQLIITLAAGALGLAILKEHITQAAETNGLTMFVINGMLFGTVVMVTLLLLFFFKLSWLVRLVEKMPAMQKYIYFIALLDDFKATELVRILSLSAVRFGVFVLQYMLLFTLFGVDIPLWQGCCAVAVMFLILAVVPMPGIAELGIRGKASIALFISFSNNPIGILVTTGSIWLINIILPAVLGSLLILNVKLFTKNEGTV